eukprot:scaffold267028_cov40-Tisochrysis_lutea.AAC.3
MQGALQHRRREQAVGRVWEHARASVLDKLHASRGVTELVSALAAEAAGGRLACTTAGERVAEAVLDPDADAAAAREIKAIVQGAKEHDGNPD